MCLGDSKATISRQLAQLMSGAVSVELANPTAISVLRPRWLVTNIAIGIFMFPITKLSASALTPQQAED